MAWVSAIYGFGGQVIAGQASVGVAFLFQQLASAHYCQSLVTETMVSKESNWVDQRGFHSLTLSSTSVLAPNRSKVGGRSVSVLFGSGLKFSPNLLDASSVDTLFATVSTGCDVVCWYRRIRRTVDVI